MLRKIIHFLCGVGIGILLIAVVIIFKYSIDSRGNYLYLLSNLTE